MSKTSRHLALAIAGILGLATLGVIIFAATFDINAYKPLIVRLVQEKKQRTLSIPGEIKLTLFPRIGADLGRVMLSEHQGTDQFASIDSAKISLQLWPLLSKRLVVDRIIVAGLQANITRFADGSTNIDDLLSQEKSEQSAGFDIAGIDFMRGRIVIDDQQQRRQWVIADLDLETGRIANGASSHIDLQASVKSIRPAIDTLVSFKSGFTIDLDRQHYQFKQALAEVKGRVADMADLAVKIGGDADIQRADKRVALEGITFNASGKRAGQTIDIKVEAPGLKVSDAQVTGGKWRGEAKITQGSRTYSAKAVAPSFEGTPQAFKVPSLRLDATIKDAMLDVKAALAGTVSGDIDKLLFASPELKLTVTGRQGDKAIDGSLTTPLAVNLNTQQIDLSPIAAAFTLPNPGGGMLVLQTGGTVNLHLGKQRVAAELKGSLDDSAFVARLGMQGWSAPAYTFDIGIDRIDADRYRSTPTPQPKSKSRPAKAASAEQPIDLSAWQDVKAVGNVRVGSLKVNNLQVTNMRMEIDAGQGEIDINPLSATLYGGSLAGSITTMVSTPPRFLVKQRLTGIQVGPLLKDAMEKTPIEGRGSVQLNIAAQGATMEKIRKSLSGSAQVELRDGAVHGVNMAKAIRGAKATIGAIRESEVQQTGTASIEEKTDFSELTGSFRLTNGVARNDDLTIKSPLMRIGGAGNIDLGSEWLDYLVRATVVSTLQGQGGPELQALKGLTVPVRLRGPFNAIAWQIDVARMATDLAQQKIEERKAEALSKMQKELEENKARIQERFKDRLKNLIR